MQLRLNSPLPILIHCKQRLNSNLAMMIQIPITDLIPKDASIRSPQIRSTTQAGNHANTLKH